MRGDPKSIYGTSILILTLTEFCIVKPETEANVIVLCTKSMPQSQVHLKSVF